MANINASLNYFFVTARTAREAFDVILEETAKIGGDWKLTGPFDVGMCNGAIVTGAGYQADRVDAARPAFPKRRAM